MAKKQDKNAQKMIDVLRALAVINNAVKRTDFPVPAHVLKDFGISRETVRKLERKKVITRVQIRTKRTGNIQNGYYVNEEAGGVIPSVIQNQFTNNSEPTASEVTDESTSEETA